MATGYISLPIGGAVSPDNSASNGGPAIQRVKSSDTASSTNTPPYYLQAAFDASADESLMWSLYLPGDYASGPVLDVLFKMASAVTGAVRFEGRVAAITPGDATDGDAKAFATTNSAGATVPATTAGKVGTVSISLTNADSLAAGDFVVVQLRRDADGTTGTDDAAGDAEVIGVRLSYVTT
jgi:hypothetical protein